MSMEDIVCISVLLSNHLFIFTHQSYAYSLHSLLSVHLDALFKLIQKAINKQFAYSFVYTDFKWPIIYGVDSVANKLFNKRVRSFELHNKESRIVVFR